MGAATQRREAQKSRGSAVTLRCRARCWLSSSERDIRGGVGAQLQHLTARMVFHVHLLSARVGVVMKTYWRPNDETFGQERNEPAWPLLV
jgi:hypothetical protein